MVTVLTEEATLPSADVLVTDGKYDLLSSFRSRTTVIIYSRKHRYELAHAGTHEPFYHEAADNIAGLRIDTDNLSIKPMSNCRVSPRFLSVGELCMIDGIPVEVDSIRFSGC